MLTIAHGANACQVGLHKFIDGKDVLCLGLCHGGKSLAVGGNANAVVLYQLSYS